MNIKSLVLGLAVAASVSSTAKALPLVKNGSLETPGNTTTVAFVGHNPGTIPNWTISGPQPGGWNSVYIYDNVVSDSMTIPPQPPPPGFMPLDYRLCRPSVPAGQLGGGLQPGASCANPDGPGHFINLDGDPGFPASINQAISGLVKDHSYKLTFSWAAVQRNDQTGLTDEFLKVSLGNQVFDTQKIFLPSKGFSGWFPASHDFTWNGVGPILSFLAVGNPTGLPPSVNLDGISLVEIPEPSTLALLFASGFGLMAARARRRQTVVAD